MNPALTKLEELGYIDAVKEYAQEKGLENISAIFEYSTYRNEVIAEVTDAGGRSAHRIDSLRAFIDRGDRQHEMAVNMLKACVDQIASEAPGESAANDGFFRQFPSLDPSDSRPPWERTTTPLRDRRFTFAQQGKPAKKTATVPPPEAGKRPKRKILD